ncbi:MAG: histidine kinase, partial [Planctomycetota bacterium]
MFLLLAMMAAFAPNVSGWETSLTLSASHSASSLDLSGRHAFRFGDDSAWANPQFDDRDWGTLSVPGSWTGTVDPLMTRLRGWYRIRFRIDSPIPPDARVDFSLGVVSDAAVAYLNGQPVASRGSMYSETGGIFASIDGVPNEPWTFSVPAKMLNPNRPNLLAIRVHRSLYNGGILEGPLLVQWSENHAASARHRQLAHVRWWLEGALLSLQTMPVLLSAVMLLTGFRQPTLQWLLLTAGVTLLLCILESRCYAVWLPWHWVRQRIYLSGLIVLPALSHHLMSHLFRRSSGPTVYLWCATGIMLIFPNGVGWVTWLGWSWLAVFACLILVWVSWSIRALVMGAEDAKVLCAGIGILALFSFAEMFEWFGSDQLRGLRFGVIGVSLFYLCGILVASQRLWRRHQQTLQIADENLAAYEKERRRIATQLHDSIAQSITAIQLRMQMAAAGSHSGDPNFHQQLLGEIITVSDEIRDLSHDLHPSVLEHQTLGAAMIQLAEQTQSRTGILVDCDVDSNLQIVGTPAENLYRILQE